MALDSYSGLKSEIANWMMGRTDLATDVDTFIDLAEADFNRLLRVRQMETTATVTLTNSVGTLPSDYLQFIAVTSRANPTRALTQQSRDHISDVYGSGVSGTPSVFIVENTTISVYPLSTDPLSLSYYAKIPSLSDANTSNWLLALYPNAYLFMCLKYAGLFIRDDAAAQTCAQLANAAIQSLISTDLTSNYARIAPRLSTPCP